MKAVIAASLLVLLATTGQAAAWGQEGHSIIAEIAQHHLTPNAEHEVEAILKGAYARMTPAQAEPTGTVSLSSVASWPDDYRPPGDVTRPWHYVDIPFEIPGGMPTDQITFEALRDCTPNGTTPTCIIDALDQQLAILKAPAPNDVDGQVRRWQALLFVVHFVGDLHQPLHCIERSENGTSDAGGNGLAVGFKGQRPNGSSYSFSGNLHSRWDSGLIEMHVYDWGAYVMELEAEVIPGFDQAAVTSGTTIDWANECHRLGIKAYRSLPPGTPVLADFNHAVALTNNYSDQVADDLGAQLARGGLRLASVLNGALDN